MSVDLSCYDLVPIGVVVVVKWPKPKGPRASLAASASLTPSASAVAVAENEKLNGDEYRPSHKRRERHSEYYG